MIRTDKEHRKALQQLEEGAHAMELQRRQLEQMDLKREEVERAMQPVQSFHEQLKEEVEAYERMKRGDLGTLYSLASIGQWLIGVRIAKGMSQKALAERLGVSESQVSRDERNEYHGVTVERAQRILEVLGVRFRAEVEEPVVQAPGASG